MDTIHSNGTSTTATTTPAKRGPGRPRKDGSTAKDTTPKTTRSTKDSIVRRYMNRAIIREFLLLPDDVQNSIRALVRFEDTSSVEFDID